MSMHVGTDSVTMTRSLIGMHASQTASYYVIMTIPFFLCTNQSWAAQETVHNIHSVMFLDYVYLLCRNCSDLNNSETL